MQVAEASLLRWPLVRVLFQKAYGQSQRHAASRHAVECQQRFCWHTRCCISQRMRLAEATLPSGWGTHMRPSWKVRQIESGQHRQTRVVRRVVQLDPLEQVELNDERQQVFCLVHRFSAKSLAIAAMICHLKALIRLPPQHPLTLLVLRRWRSDKKPPLKWRAMRLGLQLFLCERQFEGFKLAR